MFKVFTTPKEIPEFSHTGALVFLARNAWHLERAEKDYPELRFLKIKEQAPS